MPRSESAIVVVGMSCRFPRADNPENYWRLLEAGVDAITEVPPDRWDVEAYYDPDFDAPGKLYSRHGGFLSNVTDFDAAFFGIAPREAVSMDPQQRLLLELAWEALEDGGQPLDALGATGVFLGISSNDYARRHFQSGDPTVLDAYSATSSAFSAAAGRISYLLGFRGPCVAVDTACSSSLVAVHLARKSLNDRECDVAIAGGVNLILAPEPTITFCRAHMLAPDGRCKTFDASANGYVRGEGGGLIVLKRLEDAISANDRILAVIRGSSVNQDGRSNGFTAPNGPAQRELMRQALVSAGLDAREIGYVETHGTGTALGDPIEVRALAAELAADRAPAYPLLIGSVKTNIGHLEAAAGIAGLMKVVLALQHEAIPPHLHFHQPSPHIPWDRIAVRVPTTLTPWPRNGTPRIAGVSSFGFIGTNAHVIIEESPELRPSGGETLEADCSYVLPISARTAEALEASVSAYRERLTAMVGGGESIRDLCYTAGVRRTHHACRIAVAGHTARELLSRLPKIIEAESPPPAESGGTVFVFCGQGSQWARMACDLLGEPVFRETVDRCSDLFLRHGPWSLLDELAMDEGQSRLARTEIAQPAIFAIQVGLAALWRSWGIEPAALIGHSVGEVAAAVVAGALTLEDGIEVVWQRGQAMRDTAGSGKMVSVPLSEHEAAELTQASRPRVCVAAINSPRSTVLSGDPTALADLVASLEARGVSPRWLNVNYAFHSEQMTACQATLLETLAHIRPDDTRIPIFSTVTGRQATTGDFTAEYWWRNVREPVRFADAVALAVQHGAARFLEVGPQPVLAHPLAECLEAHHVQSPLLFSLRRDRAARVTLLDGLAQLYVRGASISWRAVNQDGGRVVTLPNYPFQRKRFWLDAVPQRRTIREVNEAGGHPLLGSPIPCALDDLVFETCLNGNRHDWLEDHKVFSEVVVPGSALVAMALNAADIVDGERGRCSIENITFPRALVIPQGESRTVQVIVRRQSPGAETLEIFSRCDGTGGNAASGGEWTLHASGRTAALQAPEPSDSPSVSPEEAEAVCLEESGRLYTDLDARGIALGPRFRWVTRLCRGRGEAIGKLVVPDAAAHADTGLLHPGLVDSCFQLLSACLPQHDDERSAYVPFSLERASLSGRADGQLWCHARLRDNDGNGDTIKGDLILFDQTRRTVAEFLGVEVRRASREALLGHGRDDRDLLWDRVWRESQRPAQLEEQVRTVGQSIQGGWLIFTDASGVGESVAEALERGGARVVRAAVGEAVQVVGADRWTVPPADHAALLRLFSESFPDHPPAGIVFAWALDARSRDDDTADSVLAQQRTACASIPAIVSAIPASGRTLEPRLWLITRGAQAIGSEAIAFAQAGVWGLGETIRAERPEIRCVSVDLDPAAGDPVSVLLGEFDVTDNEDRVAFRAGVRYVARLTRHLRRAGSATSPLSRHRAYLITGGYGALGLAVADWLVRGGARHVVLVGRHVAPTPALEAIERLRNIGARVEVLSADVSRADEVDRLISDCCADGVALGGIVHAAGVLDDAEVLNQTWERISAVMAPKIAGAWNLHRATQGHDLEFFVLFSSAAAVLGSAGQAGYAAANAMLDAFAHFRRALRLPALSINWGPWSIRGMAAAVGPATLERWRMAGVGTLSSSQGMDVLSRLLDEGAAQALVIKADWRTYAAGINGHGRPPLLKEIVSESRDGSRKPARQVAGDLKLDLERRSMREREQALRTRLTQEAATVLGFSSDETLDPQRPLSEIGLDSLMALQLRTAVEQLVGRVLPATLLFNYPTLDALARFLASELFPREKEPPPKQRRERQSARRTAAEDAIAVIGMGCRFPGGANDPEAFWQSLRNGVDTITEVPASRWSVSDFYDPNPDAPGRMYTKFGGFLGDVTGLDAEFFGIAPREVIHMDPQQRLLLEVTWEALESAGLDIRGLAGSRTGVYVGISTHDYASRILNGGGDVREGLQRIDAYYGTGNTLSVSAGRLSYVLGLEGPSVALDTACSSSLVSVHLACQSLRAGESDLALAGGVNVILGPENTIYFSKLRALSPDGRCKAFDARANGYVRGEGCGVVVLKRLSEALRDRDPVVAVIRGSAVNQDGRSGGLTAPNGLSQERVIRSALGMAGVEPAEVDYVEAHGTGTPLGDPIELQALASVYGENRPGRRPLIVGSVKANIGHLETAAGVAGFIKAALALQHEMIPPQVNFETPNPHVAWADIPLTIPTGPLHWTRDGRRRLAAVSSFGFSGTNAHVVIEEAPARPHRDETVKREGPWVVALSARSKDALRARASAMRDLLVAADTMTATLPDIAYTTGVRRTHHEHRVAVIGKTHQDVSNRLDGYLKGEHHALTVQGECAAGQKPQIGFVLSGQGSQWAGMGLTLLGTEPVFRATLDRCEALFREHASWSLLDEIALPSERSRLSRTEIAQPALFAIQVALANLWKSWGIEPDVVVGHSSGEVAAAHLAGVLDLETAAAVAVHRGRLMQRTADLGRMVAIALSEDETEACVRPYGSMVSLAAVNGPMSCVVSGDAVTLGALVDDLKSRGIECRDLGVPYAFHSAQMDEIQTDLLRALESVRPSAPSVPIVSTVTGRSFEEGDFGAPYWWRSVRQPVRFDMAVDALLARGVTMFLEVAPHPVLGQPMAQCLEHRGSRAAVSSSLRRGRDDRAALLTSLAALHCAGCPVRWEELYDRDFQVVPLPSYPFQRSRFWLSSDTNTRRSDRPAENVGSAGLPLLGAKVRSASSRETIFETKLGCDSLPLLNDHRVYDRPILPAAAYLEMAAAAARETFGQTAWRVDECVIQEALDVADEPIVQVVVSDEGIRSAFRIASFDRASSTWALNASGYLTREGGDLRPRPGDSDEEAKFRLQEASVQEFYARVGERGLGLGHAFQTLTRLWWSSNEALALVRMPPPPESPGRYVVHPALIDAGFQLFAAGLMDTTLTKPALYLPVSVGSFWYDGRVPDTVWVHLSLHTRKGDADQTLAGDVRFFDQAGRTLGRLENVSFKSTTEDTFSRSIRSTMRDWIYEVEWPVVARADLRRHASSDGPWLVLSDDGGVGGDLVRRLQLRGDPVIELSAADVAASPRESRGKAGQDRVTIDAILANRFSDHPPRGIVHLGSVDAVELDAVASPLAAQEAVCGRLLSLVQTLSRMEATRHQPLWIVTRGAHGIGGDAIALGQGAVTGLVRVISQEHPELNCVQIDLDPSTTDAEQLLEELLHPDDEDLVALRRGQRQAARLERSRFLRDDSGRPTHSQGSSTCLITGGLGALGIEVARSLAGRGFKHLVLVGRHGPSDATRVAVDDLRAAGTTVMVAQADVSRRDDIRHVLETVRASMPPLGGVVHAAGVLDDGVIVDQRWDRFKSVMAPKIEGAWNLHLETLTDSLEFFVLFSSIASVIGSRGQASYAAANAWLNAFAHYRRGMGLCAQSIAWGPWESGGMSATVANARRWADAGIRLISRERGTTAFDLLLGSGPACPVVFGADWSRLSDSLKVQSGASLPLLDALTGQRNEATSREAQSVPDLLVALDGVADRNRMDVVYEHLRRYAAEILSHPDPRGIDVRRPLTDLGLDSLMSLDLKTRLERAIGVSLSSTFIFEYPTLEGIAAYLEKNVLAPRSTPSVTRSSTVPENMPRAQTVALETISDEDAEAALIAELDRLDVPSRLPD